MESMNVADVFLRNVLGGGRPIALLEVSTKRMKGRSAQGSLRHDPDWRLLEQ
jgi:hypothetical protein